MLLNSTIQLPNPNKGYKTTINMAFNGSMLGNGKWSNFDSGQKFDMFSCKCVFYFTAAEQASFHTVTSGANIGTTAVITNVNSTGFYPFSPAISEPGPGYTVYITDVKSAGMSDDLGNEFKTECTFLWAYSEGAIVWNALDPIYCNEGSLSFAGYDNILFPGFKPKQGLSSASQPTGGGYIYGFSTSTTNEMNSSKMKLKLRTDLTSNIVNKLVNTYRGNAIDITGAENYYIFTLSEGDSTSYTVKLKDNELKIKNITGDQFEIDLEFVRET